MSFYPPVCRSLSVCVCVCVFMSLSIYLSICLSAYSATQWLVKCIETK